MEPLSVVEGFTVVEDRAGGLGAADEGAAVHEFFLVRALKALHGGVVIAVALSAHAQRWDGRGLCRFTDAKAAGWIDQEVTGGFGKLYGAAYKDWSQFGAQLIGGATNILVVGALAWTRFKIANSVVPMRSKRQDEIVGLDIPEVGAEAYSDSPLTDPSSPSVEGQTNRRCLPGG